MVKWIALFWIFIKINLLTTSGQASVGLLYKEAVGKLMSESEFVEAVLHLVIYLAQAAEARIILLHVVEPVSLDYPVSKLIDQNWEHILETDTPQGRNLKQALDEIETSGLKLEFKVRHGNVVHEISNVLQSGEYDLIGMGSHFDVRNLRQMYLPDVTAEVAEKLNCPVITARLGHELVTGAFQSH